MPSFTLPVMALPSIAPVNSRVSAIGWTIESFQATLLPFTVPSKISAAPSSADCVPSSLPPALLRTSFALRSPIGVSIVTSHVPSAAMLTSLFVAAGFLRAKMSARPGSFARPDHRGEFRRPQAAGYRDAIRAAAIAMVDCGSMPITMLPLTERREPGMSDRPFRPSTLIPALSWIRTYTTKNVRLDLIAGLSLAAFVIPESLAYASLAQLPPVTGLYCYLVAGIAYMLFGTSRRLAVGPTSSLAIVVAAGVAVISAGDPTRFVALASALA